MSGSWPLPRSPLPMLPTSSHHSAPVNLGPLCLLPLCLERSYLSKACSLVQSWHKCLLEEAFPVLPLASYVRFASPCAGRGGSSSGNDNTQSRLRFLGAYHVPGLFRIRVRCTTSFNRHYRLRMWYHCDAAASAVAGLRNGPQWQFLPHLFSPLPHWIGLTCMTNGILQK